MTIRRDSSSNRTTEQSQDGDADVDGKQQQAVAPSQSQDQTQLQQAEQVMAAEVRLISLFGDITEIVCTLGAEDYLVARDASSIYPPAAEELPDLGFAGALSAEAILKAAGGDDAAAESGIVGWQPLTPEALVAADPDVYVLMDRGLAVIGGVEPTGTRPKAGCRPRGSRGPMPRVERASRHKGSGRRAGWLRRPRRLR